MKLNYSDLSKQAKIGYNALYNVIFSHSVFIGKEEINKFTVPLCLDSSNKVSLTERNFIYFDSILVLKYDPKNPPEPPKFSSFHTFRSAGCSCVIHTQLFYDDLTLTAKNDII